MRETGGEGETVLSGGEAKGWSMLAKQKRSAGANENCKRKHEGTELEGRTNDGAACLVCRQTVGQAAVRF